MKLLKLLFNISVKQTYYILGLSIINGIAGGLLLILYSNAIIDLLTKSNYKFYVIILPIIIIIFLLSKRYSQKKVSLLIEQYLESIVLKITNSIRHLKLSEFEKINKTEIFMSIINSKTITQGVTIIIDIIQVNLLLLIAWIYIFFFISKILGIFLIFWCLFFLITLETFQKIIKSLVHEELTQHSILSKSFKDILYGFKELKFNLNKSDEIFNIHFTKLITKIKNKRIQNRFYFGELFINYSLSSFIVLASSCFIYFNTLDTYKLIIGVIIALSMFRYILSIIVSTQKSVEGMAALERLNKQINLFNVKEPDQLLHNQKNEKIKNFQEFEMKNISYTYHEENVDIPFNIYIDNFRIKRGDIIFIVGGNGSGKSTFLKVLTGLYKPDSGICKIDGNDYEFENHKFLFSTIFTDYHLFDKLYGIDKFDDDKIDELIRTMKLNKKTKHKNGKFTNKDLSVGQMKRLALIISILEDKQIYIFDEWAANQDYYFRKYFYTTFLPLMKNKGKSVIAVTHDDHFFNCADYVIKMENGKNIEKWIPDKSKNINFDIFSNYSLNSNQIRSDSQLKEQIEKNKDYKQFKNEKSIKKNSFFVSLFKESNVSLSKIIFLILMVSFSIVGLNVLLINSANLHANNSIYLEVTKFVLLLILLMITTRNLNKHFYGAVEQKIYSLQFDVINCIRKINLQSFEKIGQTKIFSILNSEIKAISDSSNLMLQTILGGIRTIMIYILVCIIYWPAFVLMIIITIIGSFIYSFNHLIIIDFYERLNKNEKQLFDNIEHLIKGFKELKINDKKSDDFYIKSIVNKTNILKQLRYQFNNYYINNYIIAYSFWNLLIFGMILSAPFLKIPVYIVSITIGLVMIMPINQIIDNYSHFHIAYMSLKQIIEFEDLIRELNVENIEYKDQAIFNDYYNIEYKNICFEYTQNKEGLFFVGPIDLNLKKGDIIFIAGGNGSGKSTLIKMITGLYNISGDFYFNGKKADIRSYRELFSVIFTDSHLFETLYGIKNIDEKKISSLLKEFHLDDKVKLVNNKFNTINLSTGQRKRLSLIISILEDKPIYILDEWAADQDPQFRKYFYEVILTDLKNQGKTVIAVTHDEKYYNIADQVLIMDYGKIIT